jgi:hypothetical protein
MDCRHSSKFENLHASLPEAMDGAIEKTGRGEHTYPPVIKRGSKIPELNEGFVR